MSAESKRTSQGRLREYDIRYDARERRGSPAQTVLATDALTLPVVNMRLRNSHSSPASYEFVSATKLLRISELKMCHRHIFFTLFAHFGFEPFKGYFFYI
jgi:hypothetical protein